MKFDDHPDPFLTKGRILQGDDMRYPSYTDANLRLAYGLVMFGGVPCNTGEFASNGYTTVTSYDAANEGQVHMNDSRIELASPHIGWVDCSDIFDPTYISRVPERQQKQALEIGRNVHAFRYGKKHIDVEGGMPDGYRWSYSDYNRDPACRKGLCVYYVGRAILGKFPTITAILSRPSQSGAFSDQWALVNTDRGLLLFHGQTVLGYFSRGVFFVVSEKFTKVREATLRDELLRAESQYSVARVHAIPGLESFDAA